MINNKNIYIIERYGKTSPWAQGLTNRKKQKEEEEVNLSL
jgi:hypothetical protein